MYKTLTGGDTIDEIDILIAPIIIYCILMAVIGVIATTI